MQLGVSRMETPWRFAPGDRVQAAPSESEQACLCPGRHTRGEEWRWRSDWRGWAPRHWSWRSQRNHRRTDTRTADSHTSVDRERERQTDRQAETSSVTQLCMKGILFCIRGNNQNWNSSWLQFTFYRWVGIIVAWPCLALSVKATDT